MLITMFFYDGYLNNGLKHDNDEANKAFTFFIKQLARIFD